MSTLDDLRASGMIEAVDVDQADQWLRDAARHLKAAGAIADIDPAGAYVAEAIASAGAIVTAGGDLR